ncbi:hypothetical protein M9H77_02839 [Catharanthus roseus]|uniref:Uncharacterized protein n=1 Tax=Catharanthus roseus TaxID=4058 RepID=A0ACC0CA08_CATRO|nr:hypothetical protein M9H77_02839 [Catharanthus roseus]
MEMLASMQAQINSRFDVLDGKISNIQERVMRLEARGREETNEKMWISKGMKKAKQKGNFKFISLCFIPYMHKSNLKDDLQRNKRSLKITRVYEVDQVKDLEDKMVRDSFISSLEETFFEKLSLKN